MTRPLLIDLYCGAGGAAMGYHQAGFDVIGVDLFPQPRFPFVFIQADVLKLTPEWLRMMGADAVHASPKCQKHSAMKSMHNAKVHEDQIPGTRALLRAWDGPWIMENVEGAPLIHPLRLCGSMFGLGVEGARLQRHRDFESQLPLTKPGPCVHPRGVPVLGVYGDHARNRKRRPGSADRGVQDFTQAQANAAMGIDWMTFGELSEAIPPAYTRHLGAQLLEHIRC